MNRAIVLVLCLAAAGGVAVYTQYSRGDTREPVYTVPARPSVPASKPSAPAPVATGPIDPEDKAALARALQRELKRVGCYNGEISGVWTASTRTAMRTFVERVNAALPIDSPDPVLLSLVQGHQERACKEPADVERPAEALPAAAAAAAAGTAALATPRAAKTDAQGATSEWQSSTSSGARPPAATPSGGTVPPEGMVRDQRPRRAADAQPQPPKVVRDLLRAFGFK